MGVSDPALVPYTYSHWALIVIPRFHFITVLEDTKITMPGLFLASALYLLCTFFSLLTRVQKAVAGGSTCVLRRMNGSGYELPRRTSPNPAYDVISELDCSTVCKANELACTSPLRETWYDRGCCCYGPDEYTGEAMGQCCAAISELDTETFPCPASKSCCSSNCRFVRSDCCSADEVCHTGPRDSISGTPYFDGCYALCCPKDKVLCLNQKLYTGALDNCCDSVEDCNSDGSCRSSPTKSPSTLVPTSMPSGCDPTALPPTDASSLRKVFESSNSADHSFSFSPIKGVRLSSLTLMNGKTALLASTSSCTDITTMMKHEEHLEDVAFTIGAIVAIVVLAPVLTVDTVSLALAMALDELVLEEYIGPQLDAFIAETSVSNDGSSSSEVPFCDKLGIAEQYNTVSVSGCRLPKKRVHLQSAENATKPGVALQFANDTLSLAYSYGYGYMKIKYYQVVNSSDKSVVLGLAGLNISLNLTPATFTQSPSSNPSPIPPSKTPSLAGIADDSDH
jgi:hypothetical protein